MNRGPRMQNAPKKKKAHRQKLKAHRISKGAKKYRRRQGLELRPFARSRSR